MGYISLVCVCAPCYSWSPSIWSPLFDPCMHIAGSSVFFHIQWQQHACDVSVQWPDIFSLYPQTALETILVNSEKSENVWWWETPRQSAQGKYHRAFFYPPPLLLLSSACDDLAHFVRVNPACVCVSLCVFLCVRARTCVPACARLRVVSQRAR